VGAVAVGQAGYVLLGDNQDVHGGDGVNYLERENIVILVALLRRDFAPDYLAKNTIRHGIYP
jgi:hypothetical protein